jgi:hypothetical protein
MAKDNPREFHHDNQAALEKLTGLAAPAVRVPRWHTNQPQPDAVRPAFDRQPSVGGETCVIVDTPGAHILKRFTPAVLQRPLPETEPAPTTRSVDWIIRDAGKIGRHFTRALLGIIETHLEAEQVALDADNLDRINRLRLRVPLLEFLWQDL